MGLLWTTNHIHPTKTEFVTREVHEHRAPTDESVRLLNEMQQKAAENLIRTAHIENTVLRDAIAGVTQDVFGDYTVWYRFTINGHEVMGSFKLSKFDFNREGERIICQRLIEELAHHIMAGLTKDIAGGMMSLGAGRTG